MIWFIVVANAVQFGLVIALFLIIRKITKQLVMADELIIRFISQNQSFYEGQKAIGKLSHENIQLLSKEVKDVGNLRTGFQKLADSLNKYSMEYVKTYRDLSTAIKKIKPVDGDGLIKSSLEKMKNINSQLQTSLSICKDIQKGATKERK